MHAPARPRGPREEPPAAGPAVATGADEGDVPVAADGSVLNPHGGGFWATIMGRGEAKQQRGAPSSEWLAEEDWFISAANKIFEV